MADEVRILVPRASIARRGFLGLGAAGLASWLLAACGGDGGGGGSRTQVTAPPVAKAPTDLEDALNIYSWADYSNPDNIKAFQTANDNIKVKVDTYDSNEAAIAKLELAGAKAGYDVIVPTGVFIPQMVQRASWPSWTRPSCRTSRTSTPPTWTSRGTRATSTRS